MWLRNGTSQQRTGGDELGDLALQRRELGQVRDQHLLQQLPVLLDHPPVAGVLGARHQHLYLIVKADPDNSKLLHQPKKNAKSSISSERLPLGRRNFNKLGSAPTAATTATNL